MNNREKKYTNYQDGLNPNLFILDMALLDQTHICLLA